ncbi:uncharacterized protein LOC123566045 [Mercenaria mercenaria]|uniref:uncharacterized protein LOC123566045 n=1 Tax=Mercenaria mercenaria TaxID=6596 RepID=UPI001E1D9B84|nr:uncharacterized protein LOC123566045 [Mercenaria mercenaria]XP_045215805.1 uncharacterized protein LOC123566045 [Mercenaria mercenaria]XP_045215806.1 uncharacterized protein LOC123566045 [Mercenaria mercenaria]
MAHMIYRIKVVAALLTLHIIAFGIIVQRNSMVLDRPRSRFDATVSRYQFQPSQKLPTPLLTSSRTRWIIMSLAVSTMMSRGYEFCLPIVVAAWKQIGWHSLIFVVESSNVWNTSTVLKLVRDQTLDIDPTARFVRIPVSHNPVSFAQVSRLFAILFAPWIRPNDLVMTTDIDLIPIKKNIFDEVEKSDISLLNTNCCGSFIWNNTEISMQPMSYVAMSAKNWLKVMDIRRPFEKNETHAHYINSWLTQNYGKVIPSKDVVKGGNAVWFLDQRVVSIQLYKTSLKTYKRPQRTSLERADRARDNSWTNFKRFMDAHMYYDSFKGAQWNRTFRLITYIFSVDVSEKLKFYREQFVKYTKYST